MQKIITLLSDFGLQDGYVAAMKGVILTIRPQTVLVDISHMVPPQDIQWGAFILATACPFFPTGSIHLGVVDPGVGTSRRPLLVEADGRYFVGPDNGLFSLVIERAASRQAWELDRSEYWLPHVGSTFHGRDIFAPTAAHLAAGVPPGSLGTPCEILMEKGIEVTKSSDGVVVGRVIHIDHFGNAVTNIAYRDLTGPARIELLRVEAKPSLFLPFIKTYGDMAKGSLAALWSSHGLLEIAMNGGNAAQELDLHRGCPVRIIPDPLLSTTL